MTDEKGHMKLYCSHWFPYQHVGLALRQFAKEVEFEQAEIGALNSPLVDAEFGPFIAMVDDEHMPPVIGMRQIIEVLHRTAPTAGYLPDEPIARAFARAFSEKVEEGFARLSFATIDHHPDYTRPRWLPGSKAREAILEDYGRRLPILDNMIASRPAPYIAGDHPTMADCLLAAYWWTSSDFGQRDKFKPFEHLERWAQARLAGDPFISPELKVHAKAEHAG